MSSEPQKPANPEDSKAQSDKKELANLLQELRILQQGVQVLMAFLTILPFNQGFSKLDDTEKWVYILTFFCSAAALVFFSAPAAQHRLAQPILRKERFEEFATRMTIVGMIFSSLGLVLAIQLVVAAVMGAVLSLVVAGTFAVLIVALWWVLPIARKKEYQ